MSGLVDDLLLSNWDLAIASGEQDALLSEGGSGLPFSSSSSTLFLGDFSENSDGDFLTYLSEPPCNPHTSRHLHLSIPETEIAHVPSVAAPAKAALGAVAAPSAPVPVIPPQPQYMSGLELDLDAIKSPELRALIVELYSTPLTQLRQRFQGIFKKPTSSNNRRWLLKRLTDYYLSVDSAGATANVNVAAPVASPTAVSTPSAQWPFPALLPAPTVPLPTPTPLSLKRSFASASPESSEAYAHKKARPSESSLSDAEASEVRILPPAPAPVAAPVPASLLLAQIVPGARPWSRPELDALISAVELCRSIDRWNIIQALDIPALRGRSNLELGACWSHLSFVALSDLASPGHVYAGPYPKDLIERVKSTLVALSTCMHIA